MRLYAWMACLVCVVALAGAEERFAADGAREANGKTLVEWLLLQDARQADNEQRKSAREAVAAIPTPGAEELWTMLAHELHVVRAYGLLHLCELDTVPESVVGHVLAELTRAPEPEAVDTLSPAEILRLLAAVRLAGQKLDGSAATKAALEALATAPPGHRSMFHQAIPGQAMLGLMRLDPERKLEWLNKLLPQAPLIAQASYAWGSTLPDDLRALQLDPALVFEVLVPQLPPQKLKAFAIALVPDDTLDALLINIRLAPPGVDSRTKAIKETLRPSQGRHAIANFALLRSIEENDAELIHEFAEYSSAVYEWMDLQVLAETMAMTMIAQPPEANTALLAWWHRIDLYETSVDALLAEALLADPARLDLAEALISIAWLQPGGWRPGAR